MNLEAIYHLAEIGIAIVGFIVLFFRVGARNEQHDTMWNWFVKHVINKE